jgi:uncharacterized protein YlxP (DUF503 family)
MSVARVALGMVDVHLPAVDSLKGKRQILKSLKDKVRGRFEDAVAEVDHHDVWQRATLAVACVPHDARPPTRSSARPWTSSRPTWTGVSWTRPWRSCENL